MSPEMYMKELNVADLEKKDYHSRMRHKERIAFSCTPSTVGSHYGMSQLEHSRSTDVFSGLKEKKVTKNWYQKTRSKFEFWHQYLVCPVIYLWTFSDDFRNQGFPPEIKKKCFKGKISSVTSQKV